MMIVWRIRGRLVKYKVKSFPELYAIGRYSANSAIVRRILR